MLENTTNTATIYPNTFGMLMPNRYNSSSDYRYGFNGKEKDDEVKGNGNQQDYGFRIYDPRLGKFLSVDPLTKDYPWYTPYQFAGNTPIQAIDLDGLEPQYVNESGYNVSGSDHTFNVNPLYDSPTLRQVQQNDKAALTQSNNELKALSSGGTVRQGKSNYEKAWERTTPTWSQAWIKTDPVLKSVAVSGAVAVGVTALPSVPSLYTSAQATMITIEGSQGGIAIGTGVGIGVLKSTTDAPPDIPAFFNNPIVNAVDEGTQAIIGVAKEMGSSSSTKQNDKQSIENKLSNKQDEPKK